MTDLPIRPLTRRQAFRGMAALAVLPAAAGCTLVDLGREEAPQLFVLTPKSTFREDLPEITHQLVIEVPVASEGLDTHRIALRRTPLTLDYFAGARWTERAPRLVQTLLVESFENTRRIVSVARDGTDLRADYHLKTELREFQAEYTGDGPPTARVRLNAKLVASRRRNIIASRTSETRLRATSSAMEPVIASFDAALGRVMRELVEWTLFTIAQTPDPRAAAPAPGPLDRYSS